MFSLCADTGSGFHSKWDPGTSEALVRDLVREDRKAMEEARSARCPKEQIQRGHADVAERRTG